MADPRTSLVDAVQAHAGTRECWETAGTCIVESQLRERLDALGVEVTDEVALGIMAASMVLAEHTPEFGGDARDVLGELCLVGLGMLSPR